MYVKYGSDGEIVSLFLGCVPDCVDEYEEVPDDDAAMAAFIASHQAPQPEPDNTQEARITALENMLAAYEAAYAEGVAEA